MVSYPHNNHFTQAHYSDAIMGAMASQITSLTIVCSTVYSGADHQTTKAPRHWPLCGEFTGDRWIPQTKVPVTQKTFLFDDVIMNSCCIISYFETTSNPAINMPKQIIQLLCGSLWQIMMLTVNYCDCRTIQDIFAMWPVENRKSPK